MNDFIKQFFDFLKETNPEKASELQYYLNKEGIKLNVRLLKMACN